MFNIGWTWSLHTVSSRNFIQQGHTNWTLDVEKASLRDQSYWDVKEWEGHWKYSEHLQLSNAVEIGLILGG
jgi:hypothetical protein